MATSAVLPKHENSDRDLAFTVMGVNFISTVTMVIYPTLREVLGFSLFETLVLADQVAPRAELLADARILFRRGWHTGNFRAIRNNVHLTHIVPSKTDRLKKYEVQIEQIGRAHV